MAQNTKKNLQRYAQLAVWLDRPWAMRLFVGLCLGVLFVTTLLWVVLSARLHELNADQLIDSYLFENARTFGLAWFPGAHTFLLKWPIFALMQLFGEGPGTFMMATALIVFATVGGLVYMLHRIEKRPYVFGVWCLALASILLLVPVQPYAGALLPVGMGMTTTRNLEYLVFILVAWYAATLPRLKSFGALGVGLALTLLIASDKLFAVLAIGGCLFAAAWYFVVLRNRVEAVHALGWFLLVVTAFGLATVLLLFLDVLGVTGVTSGESASPFALVGSAKDLVLGLLFGVGALLTNFGANPVHTVTIARDLPGALATELTKPSIIAYIVNGILLIIGLYASGRLLFAGRHGVVAAKWQRSALLLVGASLAAAAVYVLTDHYYPVDARYLTIWLFAVAVAAAAYIRTRSVHIRVLGVLVLLLAVSVPLAGQRAVAEYEASQAAMRPRAEMTARVANQLKSHGVQRLVGDYWDITPVREAMAGPLAIASVNNCTEPRAMLNSRAWFEMPATTPTAYLAVRDGSAEGGPNATLRHQANQETYGGCSLQKIVGSYGVPSERLRIDDSVNDNGLADVMLLVYPNGTKTEDQAAAERLQVTSQSIPPVRKNLTALPDMADCNSGVSLQVVAHEDDDILFMNPDVYSAIEAGRCMRTVYLTAGDAGESVNYWAGRESGAKAAYAEMFNSKNEWYDEVQYVNDKKVTVSYLRGMPKVSLIFVRLPDGNLRGEGFAGNNYQSLRNLLAGTQPTITTVDDNETYTKQQLVDMLLGVMNADQPDEIRTQGSDDQADGDHADHHGAGILAAEAAAQYQMPHTVSHYVGYSLQEQQNNLSPEVVALKQRVFMAYAKNDGAVCQTISECDATRTYGSYLLRQYTVPMLAPDPVPPADTDTPTN